MDQTDRPYLRRGPWIYRVRQVQFRFLFGSGGTVFFQEAYRLSNLMQLDASTLRTFAMAVGPHFVDFQDASRDMTRCHVGAHVMPGGAG